MKIPYRTGLERLRIAKLMCACAGSFTVTVRADVVNNSWLGGAGSWETAAKWSAGVVPNNTAQRQYRVFLPPSADVTIRNPTAINLLSLDPGGTLSFARATLQIAESAAINGTVNMGIFTALRLDAGVALNGSGFIDLTDSPIESTSGPLEIGSAMTIRMRQRARVGDVSHPLINRAKIVAEQTDNQHVANVAGSSISNLGAVQALPGCYVRFDGTYTRADLGSVLNEGVAQLGGSFLNDGQVFRVDNSTGNWGMSGVTMRGGSLETADGKSLSLVYPYGTGTFDSVAVNGLVRLYQSVKVFVKDGMLLGNGEIDIGSPTSDGPSELRSTTGVLTVGQNMYVHGGQQPNNGYFSGLGGATDFGGEIVNRGTIRADSLQFPDEPGVLRLKSTTYNEGILAVDDTANLIADSTVVFRDGSVLDVEMTPALETGLFKINGLLDLSATSDALQVSLGSGATVFQEYLIIEAGSRSGTFDVVPSYLRVRYSGGNVYARIVPEPSGLSLVAFAFCALRHRQRGPQRKGVGLRQSMTVPSLTRREVR